MNVNRVFIDANSECFYTLTGMDGCPDWTKEERQATGTRVHRTQMAMKSALTITMMSQDIETVGLSSSLSASVSTGVWGYTSRPLAARHVILLSAASLASFGQNVQTNQLEQVK